MGRKSRAAAAARAKAAAAARATAQRDAPAAKRRKRNVAPADRPEARARRFIDEYNCPEAPQPTPCRLKLGSRSSRDRNPEALTWQCDCGKLNLPRRCLLTDIPVLQCECGREANVDFDFSLGDVTINNKRPIVNTNIKTQGLTDCLLCAAAANMEITFQLRSILAGEDVDGCPEIDLEDLHIKYDHARNQYKVDMGEKWNPNTITTLASIAKHKGVVSDEGPESTIHKLPEYVKVKNNFYDIVRVLADGYPLTTGIITGKKFQQLKPGHIYKAPSDDKLVPGKCRIGHAILLIGAGRIGGMNYYHFINSWGKNFCLLDENRYGFGMIRASDIRFQPIKFIRYEEDIEYHNQLASTDLSVRKLEESHTPTTYLLDAEEKTQSSACAQELEGQPIEMAVSTIATFPSEIQDEVPSAFPNTLLATLTPALVTEANMLQERFAHRYHSGSLFGMNNLNRRGESSCCDDIIGSGLDRNTGHPSCQTASKLIETEGTPLVDKDALNALIRLLRVVQPIYKGQLQRLLLNLCAHPESRTSLVQILLDMLMLDLQGSSKKSIDATEPSFRLYGCHANITYSRPQYSDGVPSLVSHGVLEALTYVARDHPIVAKFLHFLSGAKPNDEDSGESSADNGSCLLHSLSQAELRLLCSLLAHDWLSDNAYLLVAEVLKKVVALAPFICCHFINELARSMQNLTVCAMKELHLHEDSGNAILSTSLANGMPVLRVLQALTSLVTSIQAEVTDCELIPGGCNNRVTEENKHEYLARVAEHRLTTAIRPQINAFMEGFHELIPREVISIFNDKEFELLISGLPDIDLDYLKANTEHSGYGIDSLVIQWFWETVQGFSKEDKAQFPQFVTNSSKVSLECFSALQGISGPQRLQMHKAYGSTNHLPSAHICLNNLDLPEYTSKDQLQESLLLAIHEANERFGIG